ncbi:MAG: HAMP domain-containing histidine kinase [Acidobacteria bacterium]|nr:HAMP domain-containing histidine kinase [Acidobacteriota bacterium]
MPGKRNRGAPSPAAARPLNLLRYFTSAGIVVVLVLALGTLATGRTLVDRALLALERDEADSVVEDIGNLLRERGLLSGAAGGIDPQVETDVRRVMANYGVVDFSLRNPSGRALLELGEPGAGRPWPEGERSARRGEAVSRWAGAASVSAHGEQIETCAPVRDEQGRVLAVARVRRDFSPALRDTRVWLLRLAGVSLIFGGGVFASLWLLVRKADRILHEQRTALDALGRRKDEFYAICSHDLRSPLLSAHAGCRLLLERIGVSGQQREIVHENLRAVASALRLIDNLLDLARIEAGADRLQPEPTDVNEVVAQVVAGQRLVATARGIELSFDAPPEHCVVTADRLKLRRILDNLVGNALRHAPGAPVTVCMEVRAAEVRVAVRDRGQGIPPERMATIFERFNHGAGGARREGTGLGLSIAREFAEQHGGAIEVDSRPGQGAVFTLVLPRGAAAPPAGTAPPADAEQVLHLSR